MPIISGTWEIELGGLQIEANLGKNENLSKEQN
jgi:hypothetical protein